MLYSDIQPELEAILGNCDPEYQARRTNLGIKLLADKSQWDSMVGYMDICFGKDHCVTLPPDVETPLAINIGGYPSFPRDKWFEFHINSPGSKPCGGSVGGRPTWDDRGNFATFKDIVNPSQLVAFPELAVDNNTQLHVYGTHKGRIVYTTAADGSQMEGAIIPVLKGYPYPDESIPLFDQVTRVVKPETQGYIKLSAWDSGRMQGTLIGDYAPFETEPQYHRIIIGGHRWSNQESGGCHSNWIRMKYRRKLRPVKYPSDYIPLTDPLALLKAIEAVKYYVDLSRSDEGEKSEQIALRLMEDSNYIRRPPIAPMIQINRADSPRPRTWIR